MSRALLIGALILSLWPAGAVAAIILTGSNKRASSDGVATDYSENDGATADNTETTVSPPLPPEVDYAKLDRLERRLSTLLNRGRKSSATRGTSDLTLATSSERLALRYDSWLRDNPRNADRAEANVARAGSRLARAIARFAREPSRTNLTAVNVAIRASNRANKEAP